MDLLSFTCLAHSGGLCNTLSLTRPLNDYGLKLEKNKTKKKNSKKKRLSEDAIWCGTEKQRYRNSFETFTIMSKLLEKRPKRRKIGLQDYVTALALEDYKFHKGRFKTCLYLEKN